MNSRQANQQVADKAFDALTAWIRDFRQDYNRKGGAAITERQSQAADGQSELGQVASSHPKSPDHSCVIDILGFHAASRKLSLRIWVHGFWVKRRMLDLLKTHGAKVSSHVGSIVIVATWVI